MKEAVHTFTFKPGRQKVQGSQLPRSRVPARIRLIVCYTCIYIYIYIYIYLSLSLSIYIYIYIYLCVCVYMYVCLSVCLSVCMYACVHVCAYLFICIYTRPKQKNKQALHFGGLSGPSYSGTTRLAVAQRDGAAEEEKAGLQVETFKGH